MSITILVDKRFNGPPDSANGGYMGGQMARLLGGPTAVSLRVPPPLETPLRVERDGADLIASAGDGTVIAHAQPASVDIDVPPCPTLADVVAAEPNYAGFAFHAIPHCFVCGTGRDHGDGLRIFASPVDGAHMVAAAWTPEPELGTDGLVDPEFVWAALDCPGYFAAVNDLGVKGIKMFTGRMAVEQVAPVKAWAPHIVTGWAIKHEGRKHWVGTALYTAAGALCAKSDALWIEPRAAR